VCAFVSACAHQDCDRDGRPDREARHPGRGARGARCGGCDGLHGQGELGDGVDEDGAAWIGGGAVVFLTARAFQRANPCRFE
jgi:hypothetical protein